MDKKYTSRLYVSKMLTYRNRPASVREGVVNFSLEGVFRRTLSKKNLQTEKDCVLYLLLL